MLGHVAIARVYAAPREAAPQCLNKRKPIIAGGLQIYRCTRNRYTYRCNGRCVWIKIYVYDDVYVGHVAGARAYAAPPEASRRFLKATSVPEH